MGGKFLPGIYHINYTVMKYMIGSGFSTEIYMRLKIKYRLFPLSDRPTNSPFHAPPTDDDEYDAPSASVNLCKQHSERFHCKYCKCLIYLRIFTEISIQGSDILQRESCLTILLNKFAKETIICTLNVELRSFCANDK
jgi:hypothetical protein